MYNVSCKRYRPKAGEIICLFMISTNEQSLAGLFQEADDNGNGSLDRQEFASVLQNGRLGLASQIVDRVLAEADENEDGVIEYTCVLCHLQSEL